MCWFAPFFLRLLFLLGEDGTEKKPKVQAEKSIIMEETIMQFCSIKWPEGLKKTKQRECVLSVLESEELPVTAAEIYGRLEPKGVPLSTVYRILEAFTDKGIVSKIAVMENGTAVYERRRPDHRHYAFCLGCRKMIAITNCPMEVVRPQLKEDFRVLGHKWEIYGYCGECSIKTKKGKERA